MYKNYQRLNIYMLYYNISSDLKLRTYDYYLEKAKNYH